MTEPQQPQRDPRLWQDPDFILVKRFGYSLKRLLDRHPDGAPDDLIAQALGMDKEQVEPAYRGILHRLRRALA